MNKSNADDKTRVGGNKVGETQVGLAKKEKTGDSPRLPHERDQATTDQQQRPKQIIRQAQDDIDSGKKDTDLHGTPGLDKPTR